MTAILSPSSPPPTATTPRPAAASSSAHPKRQSLPPPGTASSGTTTPRTPRPRALDRPSSYAKSRMSTYSNTSASSSAQQQSQQRLNSRPVSQLVSAGLLSPAPLSALASPYAGIVVRDFAYAPTEPLFHGPPPEPSPASSGASTPAPFDASLGPVLAAAAGGVAGWDDPRWGGRGGGGGGWDAGGGGGGGGGGPGEHLPQTAYGGAPEEPRDHGPPYSEDEDLHSPVVVNARHRGWPADHPHPHHRGHGGSGETEYLAGVNGDGSATYYVGAPDEAADGPGGELVTYPPEHRASRGTWQRPPQHLVAPDGGASGRQTVGSRRGHLTLDPDRLSAASSSSRSHRNANHHNNNGHHAQADPESRYSRDYQFTIASPDEEMHGKAVALFDFVRENENELPLAEGQVLWVSYRHGAGWLVAEDPKTRESGLVPEEYVRLLRDIEGGWRGLRADSMAAAAAAAAAPAGSDNADDEDAEGTDGDVERDGEDEATPTNENGGPHPPHAARPASGERGGSSNGEPRHHPPIVSTFSTSSRDLDPYPGPLPGGTQSGQAPPPVAHYGSSSGGNNNGKPSGGGSSGEGAAAGSPRVGSPAMGGVMGKGGAAAERKVERSASGRGSKKKGRR